MSIDRRPQKYRRPTGFHYVQIHSSRNKDVDWMSQNKADRLRAYLREQVENGTYYFKSRDVAEDLSDMSSKQIGTLLRQLSDESDDELEVSKWAGGSKAVTWYVSPS